MIGLDQLPLQRDGTGVLRMAGCGPVTLDIRFGRLVARDSDGVTFDGSIRRRDGRLLREVGRNMSAAVNLLSEAVPLDCKAVMVTV